ncbi:hypothetical protein C8R46DRAFT_1042174 [Mycena filopes]|nr:hypothetical protein C8R46DRAFT_1042174 [Mycena filopes]
MPLIWDRSRYIPAALDLCCPPPRRLLLGLRDAALYYNERLWVPSTVQLGRGPTEVLLFGGVRSKMSGGQLVLTVPAFDPSWELDLVARLFAHQVALLGQILALDVEMPDGCIVVDVEDDETTFVESGEQVVLRVCVSKGGVVLKDMMYWAW